MFKICHFCDFIYPEESMHYDINLFRRKCYNIVTQSSDYSLQICICVVASYALLSLYATLFVCPSFCLFILLSICLPVYLCIYMCVSPYLVTYLYVYFSFFLSFILCVDLLSLSLSLSVYRFFITSRIARFVCNIYHPIASFCYFLTTRDINRHYICSELISTQTDC